MRIIVIGSHLRKPLIVPFLEDSKISFTFIDNKDYKLPVDWKTLKYKHYHSNTVQCFDHNYSLWQALKIAAKSEEYPIFVFQDDANPIHKNWYKIVESFIPLCSKHDIVSFHARSCYLKYADHWFGAIDENEWTSLGNVNGFRVLKPNNKCTACGSGMAMMLSKSGCEKILAHEYDGMPDDAWTLTTDMVLVHPSLFLHNRSQQSLIERK
jgi:hypothetical protein